MVRKLLSMVCFVLLLQWQAQAQSRPVVSVLGDSYSTFAGFIPEGYDTWYGRTDPDADKTDVTQVEQTWWWQLIKNGGYKMGMINSWSGATICNTGYYDRDYTVRSFLTRCLNLGNPDIILICGATNDSWAGVKMGDYVYEDWRRADLYYFRPAMAKMLRDIQQHYPNAEVYFILNTQLKEEVNESVAQICKHYGVDLIRLHDIDKMSGHPSAAGMKSFADQVLEVLKKNK